MLYLTLTWLFALICCLIILFILFWKFIFLRDPERKIPHGNYIICPADGKINQIIHIDETNFELKKGILGKFLVVSNDVSDKTIIVSVVMTPLDVHVQRAPIEGKVLDIKYTKGRFKNAVTSRIAIDNERNEILIQGKIKLKVIQIAGALARRIECFVIKDQLIKSGQRIGRINFGSQVSLVLPAGIKLKVKKGQKVKAGETIIAEFD
jgi:phosphatidylserine decarboxylase